jgi:hypothetical protein
MGTCLDDAAPLETPLDILSQQPFESDSSATPTAPHLTVVIPEDQEEEEEMLHACMYERESARARESEREKERE